MNPSERLHPQEEKARYDLHQNQDSSEYRQFLQPLVQEIQNHGRSMAIPPETLKILDYGCGPTAFLSALLAENSFKAVNYDLFYFPDTFSLQATYDVITCTEVWEHLHHPYDEITRLHQLLKPSGLLAVMTASHPGVELFHHWHYRRDLTHVIFFSDKTMRWIGAHFHLELCKAQTPYWFFRKRS
jgi:SAM-dependent methyltransferase